MFLDIGFVGIENNAFLHRQCPRLWRGMVAEGQLTGMAHAFVAADSPQGTFHLPRILFRFLCGSSGVISKPS